MGLGLEIMSLSNGLSSIAGCKHLQLNTKNGLSVILLAHPPSLPPSLVPVNGGWTLPKRSVTMPDPLNGQPFLQMPDTTTEELGPYIDSLKSVPKSGLHNPFKVGR
jgi:hypothetical protein